MSPSGLYRVGERVLRISVVPLLFVLAGPAQGEVPVRSDCSGSELRLLRSEELRHQVIGQARLLHGDCTVLHDKENPKLLIVFVTQALNEERGTYLAVFSRKGLSLKSHALFTSGSLGMDAFPMLAQGQRRLVFVLPAANPKTIIFYTNIQNAPNAGHFQKWELNLNRKELTSIDGHDWPVDPHKMPQIYNESTKWKGIVNRKLVEL